MLVPSGCLMNRNVLSIEVKVMVEIRHELHVFSGCRQTVCVPMLPAHLSASVEAYLSRLPIEHSW